MTSRIHLAAALAAAAPLFAFARPAWVDAAAAPARPSAAVVAVDAGVGQGSGDLAVLAGGVEAGLRPGQVLTVERPAGTPVAELLVAAVRADRSVAWITRTAPEQSLQPGDLARARIR